MASAFSRPFNLQTCARQNILNLVPYQCARDDYKDDGTHILLDANENAYGPSLLLQPAKSLPNGLEPAGGAPTIEDYYSSLHRYPDPHQIDLKQQFCNMRNMPTSPYPKLTPGNLFLGVGSDECIDALLRCFCRPGTDKILTCPPTYGMYSVSAQTNDIEVVRVDLELSSTRFELRADAINAVLSADPNIKLVYLCSPGNPTGALVDPDAVKRVLNHPTWNGVVVVDEAYIDFAQPWSSLSPWVTAYPNLVVMQTLSKAFGLAGIRLGAAFTSPGIARLMNSLKAPYSISTPTSVLAMMTLSKGGLNGKEKSVKLIQEQRTRLLRELPKIKGVGRFLGGTDSNFLLVEMLEQPGGKPDNVVALKVYEALAQTKGVVVRFRGKEAGCLGCLRITVGTESENTTLLEHLKEVLASIYLERYRGK